MEKDIPECLRGNAILAVQLKDLELSRVAIKELSSFNGYRTGITFAADLIAYTKDEFMGDNNLMITSVLDRRAISARVYNEFENLLGQYGIVHGDVAPFSPVKRTQIKIPKQAAARAAKIREAFAIPEGALPFKINPSYSGAALNVMWDSGAVLNQVPEIKPEDIWVFPTGVSETPGDDYFAIRFQMSPAFRRAKKTGFLTDGALTRIFEKHKDEIAQEIAAAIHARLPDEEPS